MVSVENVFDNNYLIYLPSDKSDDDIPEWTEKFLEEYFGDANVTIVTILTEITPAQPSGAFEEQGIQETK